MFLLAPHPKLDRPRRGTSRMFRPDWVEKYFSHVRPWHVLAVWLPFTAWCAWSAWRELPLAAIAGMAVLGALGWTLLEYGLHRFVFHFEPSPDSVFQQDLSYLIHGIHHDYPWDADRLVMPPVLAAIMAALVWIPSSLLLGRYHHAFFGGMVAGYICYDMMHYYVHHAVPTTRLGKWLRRYHLVHHFSTPGLRYGITSPLWDLVFGTYPKGDEVKRGDTEDDGEKLAI